MLENAYRELKIFCGSSIPDLGREIAESLSVSPGKVTLMRFADGEVYCRYEENARGEDVFLIQSTCHPVNEHLMELLIMVDALKRASRRTRRSCGLRIRTKRQKYSARADSRYACRHLSPPAA